MRTDYQPFDIGANFTITPFDPTSENSKRLQLIMERGAFGSGEHETTRSCIEILESLPQQKSQKVLDLGSGTGILSIATLMLNPSASALCVDIEQNAVESCDFNCRRNHVSDRVTHLCGTLDDVQDEGFDLTLANIYGDILLDVAQDLVAKTRAGGHLLLSGILWEYNFDVKTKYQRLGCDVIRSLLMEEFCTLLLQKN